MTGSLHNPATNHVCQEEGVDHYKFYCFPGEGHIFNKKVLREAKTTTVIVLSIGIVAASIVLNNYSQYLLFSLLFWFWVLSQSHCILRELQQCWDMQMLNKFLMVSQTLSSSSKAKPKWEKSLRGAFYSFCLDYPQKKCNVRVTLGFTFAFHSIRFT